jgi:acetolactate synthase-1/2/3 large subunit
MDKAPHVSVRSTSHFFLEGLNEIGIEYLFCNFGTDHAPLIEEMARWGREGRKFPKVVLCPHENTAMHMAAGVANVTGRGQGVMVHVDAGTANCAMGAHNLRRARVPVLLMAGKAPHSVRGERVGARDNYVHFIQEPYDQGGIVRNYVKWEWTLPSGVITKEVLRRAHSMAHSDPQGPVYLMLPRETLAEEWEERAVRSFSAERFGPVQAGTAEPALVAALVERLLSADYPILVASYAGRNPEAPALIEALAQIAGIRVFEGHPTHLNIARESDCYLGAMIGDHLGKADLGLLVDVDVPWIPKLACESESTYWAHIDVDVLKQDFPMWGFASNLRMQGDSAAILAQVLEAVKSKATPAFAQKAAARGATIAAESRARRKQLAKAAAARGADGAIGASYVCAELAKLLDPDDIVVNEAVRNVATVLNHVPRNRPATYFGFAGGGLGCSAGMALGAKLAKPQATVVQIVGDGGFYFNNPQSTFAVAKQYELPILTLVLDNAGWSAVKEATLRMYAEGDAFVRKDFQALLNPNVEFAKVAESVGGHGESVTDPTAVPAAIQRALAAVRGGAPAVLHVRIPAL